MKKFKKLLAVALSLTAVSAVNPLGSQAVYTESHLNDSAFQKMLENYTKIEYTELFGSNSFNGIYVRNNGADGSDGSFMATRSLPDNMAVDLSENTDVSSISEILDSYNAQNGTDFTVTDTYSDDFQYQIIPLLTDENVSAKDVKAINQLLKSENLISAFKLQSNRITIEEGFSSILDFSYSIAEGNSPYDSIKSYIEQHYPDFTVTCETSDIGDFEVIRVTPNTEMTYPEKAELSSEISRATRIYPLFIVAESTSEPISSDIDVFNSVDGDANCDNSANIADSVFILQSFANPDKYQISPQGQFNADIVNTGDGITPLDALGVQQIEAGKSPDEISFQEITYEQTATTTTVPAVTTAEFKPTTAPPRYDESVMTTAGITTTVTTAQSRYYAESIMTTAEFKPIVTDVSSRYYAESVMTTAEFKPIVTDVSSRYYAESIMTTAEFKPTVTTAQSRYYAESIMTTAGVSFPTTTVTTSAVF